MNINQQIKAYRLKQNISQEELAEKIFVTRQTVSNWETGKNYPDIHSLLLMSNLFGVSLDQLVKGDLNAMKDSIKKEDIKVYTFWSNLYSMLFISFIISFAPLLYFLDWYGVTISVILFIILIYVAFKVEKIKKANDIQTYREIVAFLNGEKLDEITKNKELGKRNYQTAFLALGFALITFIIVFSLLKLFTILFS